jgi:hypothetical protein
MTSIFKKVVGWLNRRHQLTIDLIQHVLDAQIRIEDKIEKNNTELIIRFIQNVGDELKIIEKRNSELIGLLTKYFELEKMKAEKQVAEQEANKPTEDDKRF